MRSHSPNGSSSRMSERRLETEQRRRIVDLLRQAGDAPDPTLLVRQVQSLTGAWIRFGLNSESAAEALAYHNAAARFWGKVEVATLVADAA